MEPKKDFQQMSREELIAELQRQAAVGFELKSLTAEVAQLTERERAGATEMEAANAKLREEIEQRANAEQQLKDYARALENANRALHKAYEDARAADRARLESERAARSEAEKANQMKDEFLATLSHELRTPLNALLGWAQLIRSGRLSKEDTERAMEVIERNIRLQSQLVSDLLDMSRIISGKFSLDLQVVLIAPLVESVLDSVRLSADIAGVRIETEIDPEAEEVIGDQNRLQQVLWNLLQNAVKFSTRGGKVKLSVARRSNDIEIRVRDNGIGIRPEFLPYVFDRFRQADSSKTRRQGGLGLGLSIVRHLVEAHGGAITAESEGEGKGSCFTMLLPIGYPDAQTGSAEANQIGFRVRFDPDAVRGTKVLVVDDDADSRALISRQLEELDAVVVLAASATEALRKLRSFRPDVIVSDIGMPDEDGYDLIRNVRNIKQVADIPALALTAFARPEDRDQALKAGYQMHLTKPVEMSRLCAAIGRLAARGRAASERREAAPPAPAAHEAPSRTARKLSASTNRLRILVVDDSDDSASYVAAVLEMQGHEVMIARDGSSAVEIASLFRPQMVFLDIGLPDIDGFEVARRLRLNSDSGNTVVAAVTGYEIDRRKLENSPFDALLQKPLEPGTLTTFIRSVMAAH